VTWQALLATAVGSRILSEMDFGGPRHPWLDELDAVLHRQGSTLELGCPVLFLGLLRDCGPAMHFAAPAGGAEKVVLAAGNSVIPVAAGNSVIPACELHP